MGTMPKNQRRNMLDVGLAVIIPPTIDLMACLKGAHSEVSASQALMKILQRFIENTENWSVNIKVFVVLHRCLQDFDLSQPVAQELSEKSDILTHYKKKPTENSYGKFQ